ncbi:MAG: metallophosphoesterase [Prosthecobacter sp.]|jgi:predicted MPP superfamily phosphohydrolase|uniref:metallophosphoesterase n=1 Tax=Prosthecobacter sp. TaxID=1965333 RepID=UPI0019DA6CDE|nr:metallophosphoesterase [Prosthecobacter sp.]MBE2287235.1 metallophosphoesterase [Prosthecobacter sp.]
MRPKTSRRQILRGLTALAVGGSSAAIAADRKQLQIERVEVPVPGLPPALDGFRIGQLSDLHLEPYTTAEDIWKSVQACNSLKPDLIALTGDFVTNNTRAAPLVADILSHLEAPHGVHASLGNHDFWSGAADVVRALHERKIPVLSNDTRRVQTDVGPLWLGGIDSVYVNKPDVRKTLQHWKQTQPLVLMMHEPDAADVIAAAGVKALQLSGHTHGGQLVFRGKEPMSLRRARHGKRYLAGHYRVGGLELYVNRGIGCVGLPLRIGCPPEVTELVLRSPEIARA